MKLKVLFLFLFPGTIGFVLLLGTGIMGYAHSHYWIALAGAYLLYILTTFMVIWLVFHKILGPLQKLNRHFDRVIGSEVGLYDTPSGLENTMYRPYVHKYNSIIESIRKAFLDIVTQTSRSISESSSMERRLKSFHSSLDRVRANQDKMVQDFNEVNDAVQNQAITAGDLQESGSSIQRFLNELNQDTEGVLSKAQEGLISLEASEAHLKKLGRYIQENQQDSEHLVRRLAEIESIIVSIKEIADRTNLLSLNASIEAARAGEMGRGFAVVADEVNKLADQSQYSVGEIAKTIESLVKDIQDSARQMTEISSEMNTLHEIGQQSFSSFRAIIESVKSVGHEVHEITERYEKLQTGINRMSDSAAEIHEYTDDIKSRVLSNKKVVTRINDEMDSFVENMEQMNSGAETILSSLRKFGAFSEDDVKWQLEMAKESHAKWIEKLQESTKHPDEEYLDLETNPRRCKFGIFYHNSPTPHICESKWDRVGELHEKVHEAAIEMEKIRAEQNEEQMQRVVDAAKEASVELTQILDQCIQND